MRSWLFILFLSCNCDSDFFLGILMIRKYDSIYETVIKEEVETKDNNLTIPLNCRPKSM